MKSIIPMLALLSTALLLFGCDNETVVSPELTQGKASIQDEQETAASKAEKDAFRSVASVYTILDPFGEPVGTSTLLRNRRGLSFSFRTTDLQPGHAYTLWMPIFNEPENCQSPTPESRCSEPDVRNEAAKPDLIYAAGLVVGASGEATFAGHTP